MRSVRFGLVYKLMTTLTTKASLAAPLETATNACTDSLTHVPLSDL